MPITEYLERNSRLYPNDVALVERNPEQKRQDKISWKEYALIQQTSDIPYRRELTWGNFNDRANMIANLLIGEGIKKGDKVAILLMNCLEWLPLYFGILKAGAVAVPFNFRYTSEEIEYCAEQADIRMMFFGPQFIGRIEAIEEKLVPNMRLLFVGTGFCPTFADSLEEVSEPYTSEDPGVKLTDDDDAAIYFSSGTTGFPKAILHNHQSLVHSAICEQKHHGQTRDDVFLCIPPLYHTGAKMHWFGSLISGSRAVLLRGTSPQDILQTVSEEHCTIVWLLVPWAQDILDAIDIGKVDLDSYELSQWRLMHIGAQPVPPSLIRRWKKVFPNHQYDTNYGLSEAIGPGCIHLGVENIDKVGAIGVPGYGWEAKIMDGDREVKQGEVGELCVKGPGLMTCYYKNPEATKEALRNGWLYTGDMARQDEDGFYYLVDRKKDVIVSGGENLYPVQIEDFLRAYPKIKDVAVIGLPDARLGEIAGAIISVREGMTCTEEEINEFCMKLPRYKRPRKIIFADVPRNATGKIEKPKLRKMYGQENLVDFEYRS